MLFPADRLRKFDTSLPFLFQLGLDRSTKLVPSSQSIRFKTKTNRDLRVCIQLALCDDFLVTFVVVCFSFVPLL